MKNQTTNPCLAYSDQDPTVIYHSLKGAVIFGMLLAGFGVTAIIIFLYLRNQIPNTLSFSVPLIVGVLSILLIILYATIQLFQDAGKVAISLRREGVKFDRYDLIDWYDIEEVYITEDSDGPPCLWLRVKDGVTFLPDKPRSLIWIAKNTNLHRCIDISGYGRLSMTDENIRTHLEKGLQDYAEIVEI